MERLRHTGEQDRDDLKERERIRQFLEKECVRKRNLKHAKQRQDEEQRKLQLKITMEEHQLWLAQRNLESIRFITELPLQQEQPHYTQDCRSSKRPYMFQGDHGPGQANTRSSRDVCRRLVIGHLRLHQRVEECGNTLGQRPWKPRGQVLEGVYDQFAPDGAREGIGTGANHLNAEYLRGRWRAGLK